MKKILLLINPKSRSGNDAYQEISRAIEESPHQQISLTQDEIHEDFNKIILKYKDEADLVLIGGGDGSINFVLDALVETKLPLLIYPLGTANLFARSFNIRPNLEEMLELMTSGLETTIDLGKVNGKYFINVCGLGVSTEVNGSISKTLKKLTGPFSFWIKGLSLLKQLRPYRIQIQVDKDPEITTRTWQITVCNGRKYGAWMTIDPEASYDDELLHCLSTEIKKTWQGFKLLPSYIKGDYKKHHDVTLVAGSKINIKARHKLKIDVDGDVQTCTPALFEVVPKSLRVIVPSQSLHDESPVLN